MDYWSLVSQGTLCLQVVFSLPSPLLPLPHPLGNTCMPWGCGCCGWMGAASVYGPFSAFPSRQCMNMIPLFRLSIAWVICLFIYLYFSHRTRWSYLYESKWRRMAASQPPCAVPLAWVLGAEPSPGWFSPFHQQKTPYLFFLFFLLYQFSAYLLSWMNSAAAGGCGLGGRAPFSAPPLLQPHPYLVAE